MPSPKSGEAGSAVSPADPKPAEEADKANPGEMTHQSGKYEETPAKPHKPSKEKKSWIEIELVNKRGKPVPGEPYRVTLPDGETVAEGTLDHLGVARVDGIDPGVCKITFPNLEKQAWRPL